MVFPCAATVASQSVSESVSDPLKAVDLSVLTVDDQKTVLFLLTWYSPVFSAHDGDSAGERAY